MPLQAGQIISARYRVIRILGQGGYGAVYLVEDTRLAGRTVALKESFDASADAAQQFQLEATLLARLRHPSLPNVSDFFSEPGGTRFLVMDYVEGRDLADLIQQGIVSPTQAILWIGEISEAVAYLHSQNPPIIHRDIKPKNIKIRLDNRAVLVDFGIAKLYNPQKQTARIAKAVTTGFSPPEQYGGGTNTHSDVYALGATLYCMVTQTVPPEALDLVSQKERLIPPRQLNPQVSPQLEQVILKAMSLNSLARYPSAREFADALHALTSAPVNVGTAITSVAPNAPVPGVAFQPPASDTRVHCPRCTWENRVGAKFCQKCGLAIAAAPASVPQAPASRNPPPIPQVSPQMHFELGNAYARRKQYADAVVEYERAAAGGFEDAALFYNWADALIDLDRENEAVKVLQRGIAKYPRDGDLHAELGWAYARLKQAPRAIQSLETALRYNPQPFAYLLLGLVHQELEQHDQAIPYLNKFLDAQPDSAFGRLVLGRAYLNTSQLPQAQSEFERVLKNDSKNEAAHYLMTVVHQRAKRYGEAAKWAQQLIQLAPQNPLGPYALGLTQLEQKKWNDALKSFQESARLDPKDADTHFHIALCYANLKKRDEAKRELQKAAQLDPNNKVVKELLSQL
ncbi:MAG TPA: tetratricopeptide repeat protein [Anaerolineae bacterium]|nr:tetratricopeptide repeat protein [Anaerolineae bacterium]